ncbi:MAG: peptidase S41, partial [Muribaculaceae bacterium]|nr:peptidase S41 [Muribaculaceae bacterium]
MKLKALTKKGALALLPLMLTVGIAGGLIAGRYMAVSPMSDKETKLHTILGMINEQYVDRIDVDSLLETIFPDLLSSLDPHSAYIPASDLTAVNDELEGSFSGVGIVFQIVGDTVQVIEVVPDGPAEKVGMLPGDRILSADTVV